MSSPTLDSRRQYAGSATHYQRHRPSYPAALIDWIVATSGIEAPARIADVGCGTGIATRLFAERRFQAIGIDPSEEMLGFAHHGGLARYVRAEAASTALRAGSVDLVVAAQSFHWFETAAALAEFGRILRPNGWCAAFWNLRASTAFLDEYDGLLRAYSSQYDIMARQDAAVGALRGTSGIRACQEREFDNLQLFDLEGLLGRAYSSSCVEKGVGDKAAFERALRGVFERHARAGRVEFRYRTVGLCWRLAA
jgi:SAM-dependent methyltransferase